MPNDCDKLIYTIGQQLKTDLTLGGKWMPKGQVYDIDMSKTEDLQEKTVKDSLNVSAADEQMPETQNIEPENNQTDKPAFMTEHVEEIMAKKQKLKEIACEVASCDKCELASTRLNTVPGEGNPNARLVFVGEAPGQSEDEQGRPFVGRAGKLLDNIIQAMGLTRDDVFICNILKCRPPKNRDPLMGEVNACSPYLHRQLNALNAEIIVALGTHAAHTLLETKTPIGQLRGGKMHNYHPAGLDKPIKLAATYHPAYLLRNYTQDARTKVWEDMKKVLKELDLPVPKK